MRALLLDVGGTLLRPCEAVNAVYRRIGEPYGVREVDFGRAFARAAHPQLMDGRPFWRAVVREATGCADLDYFEALYAHYRRAEAWTVAPGARALLAALRSEGWRLAVVSNWDTRLRGTLVDLGLSSMMDTLAISGELGVEKPDVRLFQAALRTLGVAPSDAVHVGDSLSKDVRPARALGMRALHFGSEGCPDFSAVARALR